MTRLYGSLPTLEGVISEHQPRLASGGWSILSERVCSRQVSIETFSHSLFLRSPFGLWFQSNERHPRFSGLWLAPRNMLSNPGARLGGIAGEEGAGLV